MRSPISCPKWVYLLLILIAGGCSKSDLNTGADSPVKGNSNLVGINLGGRITDDHQEPVSGAMVRSGNKVTQSDINGNFSLPDLLVNATATLIEVYKPGFFRSFQTIEVQPGSDQFAEINLLGIGQVQQFEAATGADLSLSGGGNLQFLPASIADKISGQSYTGLVNLYAFTLTAGDAGFFRYLPGQRAYNLDKKDVAILPLSVVITELSGNSGQSLEPIEGQQVHIIFPIAEKDISSAPPIISMWHYDLTTGIWIEEGTAVKNGNRYEGNVRHFSMWAVSTAEPLVRLQANITDKLNNGLAYAKIQLYTTSGQQLLSTISRADGKGYLVMPAMAGMSVQLRVINECGDTWLTKDIQTGHTTTWLGKIEVQEAGNQLATITGKVENCKNSGVYSGQVTISLDGKVYRASINDGYFKLAVQRCSGNLSTATVVAMDAAGNQESAPYNFEVGTGLNDIGTISTCDQQNSQFVSYTINGTNFLLQEPADSLVQTLTANSTKTTIQCFKGADRTRPAFSFSFTGTTKPGQYPVTALNITQDKLAFLPSGNIAVEITNYGTPGGFITGKCTGQVKSPSFNQILPFSFNFKVLRN